MATNGKDSDSTHSKRNRGAVQSQGQLWRWHLESECDIQGNSLGWRWEGSKSIPLYQGGSVLTFHSFHKYCLSTHYMPGRECSSPLQPWTDNQFPGVGLAPDTRDCVPAKPHPKELWGNSIWAEKAGNKEGIFCVSGLKDTWDLVQAKGSMKGCRVVGTSNGVRQGSADMTTQEVRGFQGRSWGATKKNVPYFTTLSKI